MRTMCFLVAAAAVPAQVALVRLPQLPALHHAAGDLDPVRHRIVVYGGEPGMTYEWDGSRWWQMEFGGAPGPRFAHGTAFDPVSRRTLLFGGFLNNQSLGDTWAWDGTTWTRLAPLHSPPGRHFVRMVTDYERGRVLLYGGYDVQSIEYSDTWEWDGTDWRQLTVAGPGPRMLHALAYDPLRRVVVLFSGRAADLGPPLADTWEWDGTTWRMRATGAAPAPRSAAALAFDLPRRTLVLFGGHGAGLQEYLDDTWDYDGSTWTRRITATAPPPREDTAAAVDPLTLQPLLFGGGRGLYFTSEFWQWNGTGWVRGPASPPPARIGAALFFDGSRMLMLGGMFLGAEPLDDMWSFDGGAWAPVQVSPRPPALHRHFAGARVSAVWQGHRGRVLAVVPGRTTSHTWEWDGTAWTDRAPAVAPFGFDYALAYDAGRQRAVCVTSIVGLSSTWEWDGTAWSWHGSAPQGTFGQALGYDPGRERVVLFGGGDPNYAVYGGTFEWDGSSWSPLAAGNVPPRQGAALVHDPARGRLVLLGGGRHLWQPYPDVHELIGGVWQQRLTGAPWPGVPITPAAWDPRTRSILALGSLNDPCSVWRYAPIAPARFSPYGVGCATEGLALVAGGLPWTGDTFSLALGVVQPAAPAAITLGFSRTSWQGLPLPLDLTPFGMTQCALLASPDVVYPVAPAGGIAVLSLRVPTLPGAFFYAQGFAAHAGANPLGIVASNGGAGIVGGR